MLAENEVVSLFLSLGVLLFFLANLRRLQVFPSYAWMIAAYLAYVMAMIFTIVEGYLWEAGFNFLEHLSYTLSVIFLATWIWRLAHQERKTA